MSEKEKQVLTKIDIRGRAHVIFSKNTITSDHNIKIEIIDDTILIQEEKRIIVEKEKIYVKKLGDMRIIVEDCDMTDIIKKSLKNSDNMVSEGLMCVLNDHTINICQIDTIGPCTLEVDPTIISKEKIRITTMFDSVVKVKNLECETGVFVASGSSMITGNMIFDQADLFVYNKGIIEGVMCNKSACLSSNEYGNISIEAAKECRVKKYVDGKGLIKVGTKIFY